MGYSESLQGNADRTEFRRAEKRYKLYKAVRGSIPRERAPPTDLSDVVDFRKILDLFNETGATPPGIAKLEQDQFDRTVFTIAERPGFFFIPGALSMEDQFLWIKESLVTFPQPPNRTNHNAFHGSIHNLWSAAQNQKVLVEAGNLNSGVETDSQSNTIIKGPNGSSWVFMDEKDLKEKKAKPGFPLKAIAASMLLRKLRWATLGLQFDWSERNYDVSLPHAKIPDALSRLAKELAMPAMENAEFCAEAAIINYFASDDMLGGHLDDMEADLSKPIVSISLGCKAVFLLGGESRQDPPIAMFLRSGDAVLMSGPARQCFHGVPRIFTDPENCDVPAFQSKFLDSSDASFVDYIKGSRININIRQVY